MKFTACKYLDFSEKYTDAAEKQLIGIGNGKVFWMRKLKYDPSQPAMVQFCKKRGRLNNPEACLSLKKAVCGDYEEIVHEVADETIAE